ncbi:hypothetical protein CUC04_09020 [Prevotella intermedia]|uniref:DUF2931 domain-containing protein n=2 Tax=Prevotella intermedia TaxID=28131 RepID=A0A2G9ICL8_PREIN|nr:hypothetical protein CUC04_09020 [Prevotella intermedia]
MRRNITVQSFTLLALLFCCTSCNSKKTIDSMKEDSLFIWQPSLTASKHYPVEAKYARIMVGTDMNISISDTNVGYGIGNGFSAVDFSASSGGLELPTGLDVLWLSFAEKKYYCFKQGFSKNIRERLLQLFQKGYQNENERYDCFVVTLLPGGKIWLSVAGTGCNTLVCDSLQAEEIQMTLKEFKEGYYETFKTLDNVCISGLSDYEGATENLKVNGIPTSLWKKYATHYPYDIKITFEDHAAILKSESTSASDIDADAACYFTTGEYYDLRSYEGIQNRAALKKIIFSWCVGNVCYHGEFFFDEEEVLNAFHEIFGAAAECMQSGALEIKVSKYNNLFKICLSSGTRYYQFEKTKIHVLRTASKEKEEHLVYWNYQEDGVKQYIGE